MHVSRCSTQCHSGGVSAKLYDKLREHHVQLHCDERAQAILAGRDDVTEAASDDWGMEYLDYIMSVKIVDSIDEAIKHINRYNTSHSEAIITNDYDNAQKFLNEIDAACVYVNASTRFLMEMNSALELR